MFDFGGMLSDIGSGVSDVVSDIGGGIASATNYVFDIDDGLFNDVMGWTESVLGNGATSLPSMYGQGGFEGLGIGNPASYTPESSTALVDATGETPVSSSAVALTESKPAKSFLGGFVTKDDIKGGLLAGAKTLYQRSREDAAMDWRRDLELDKIREQKRHHGAYYVGSDVKPAYDKPKGTPK